ncbi:hypothetical protein PilKf_02180 [Pillotina sp. SPG140]
MVKRLVKSPSPSAIFLTISLTLMIRLARLLDVKKIAMAATRPAMIRKTTLKPIRLWTGASTVSSGTKKTNVHGLVIGFVTIPAKPPITIAILLLINASLVPSREALITADTPVAPRSSASASRKFFPILAGSLCVTTVPSLAYKAA